MPTKPLPPTFSWLRISAAFSTLAFLSLCPAQGASLPDSRIAAPTVVVRITDASYCFARVRGLTPERLPPSYLVLQLRIQVAYRNAGTRPLIMPLEHERTIYTALKLGVMSIFYELPSFVEIQPTLKMMKDLPHKVSPDNPVDPKNNGFTVISARGDVVSPLFEEITLPVNHKNLFRRDPDLRGHRLYLRLQLKQQELSPTLETDMSDRWTRFGVPWTGSMLTNVVTFDVPRQLPQAKPCIDGPTATSDNHPADLGK